MKKEQKRTLGTVVSEILSDRKQYGTITVYVETAGRGMYEAVMEMEYRSGGIVGGNPLTKDEKAVEADNATCVGTYPAMDYSVVLKK